MKTLKTILTSLLVLSTILLQAQKIKVTKGDLGFLKGQTEVLVEYNYDDLSVGKFDNEADYIAKKTAEYNEQEAGKGDTWAKSWVEDRESRFKPKFEELINNYSAKTGCNFSDANTDAKYKLILKTTFIEPGFNVGVVRRDAMINVEIVFVETANADNVLAEMTMNNVPGRGGMGYDFDTGFRIQEAYAKCGKSLGSYLAKKAFK